MASKRPGGGKKARAKAEAKAKEASTRRRNSLALSYFQPGLKVWIENPYDEDSGDNYRRGEWGRDQCSRPMFVPAHTTKNDPALGMVTVTTEFTPALEIALPPALVWPRNNETNLDDMINFPHLHEPALLNVSFIYFTHCTPCSPAFCFFFVSCFLFIWLSLFVDYL